MELMKDMRGTLVESQTTAISEQTTDSYKCANVSQGDKLVHDSFVDDTHCPSAYSIFPYLPSRLTLIHVNSVGSLPNVRNIMIGRFTL